MSLTWCEELERWCPFLAPGDVNLVRSHHNAELRRARVTVLTYGLVTNGKERDRLLQNIASAGFKVVIADEAHYLKSKDAQRSKLLLPVLAAARRCVVLTGTPALNEPQPPIPTPISNPAPSLAPSLASSLTPSLAPSLALSPAPSLTPSLAPSLAPSPAPSLAPSLAPSPTPSLAPTPIQPNLK